MNYSVLFRADRTTMEELEVAKKHFAVSELRSRLPENSTVIARYSALPYYKELCEDLETINSSLINSYRQHRYIADLANWYLDLEDITPKTWFNLHEIPDGTRFVLKGETNSRKYNWKTHMFAENKQEAGEVYSRLLGDSLIGSQHIVIREYVPLRQLDLDYSGLPITEEYRFFILDGKVVSSAFYWASHSELLEDKSLGINPDNVPREFIQDVIDRVGKNARFFVVDIARTQSPYNSLFNQYGQGNWIVVELNDGQQSGLSFNDAETLYSNIKAVLEP